MSGYQVSNPTFAVTLSSANNTAAQISSLKSSILPCTSAYLNYAAGSTGTSVIFPTTGGFIGGIVIFSGNQFLGGQLLYLPYASQLYLAWQAYNVSILGSQIPPAARVSTTTSTTTVTNPSWGAPTIGSTCKFHIFNNNYAPNGGAVTITANPLDLNTDLVPKTNLITNTAAITIPVRQYATFQMTVLDAGDVLALVPISPTLSIKKLDNN